jgi:hypothetical protein
MGGEDRPVDELRLVLAEEPVEAEQQRPALAPRHGRHLRARLELGERGVERAPPGGPGGELGGGVLAREDERLAGERRRALDRLGGGGGRGGLDGH